MAFQKGKSGNPGGLSKEEAEARRVMQKWVAGPVVSKKFQEAYLHAMESGNATIIVDCANRLMGKVKDEVELSESDERPLKSVVAAKLLAMADALK